MKRRLALVIAVLLAVSGLVVSSPSANAASPVDFEVERSRNGYDLTWSPVKGAASYRLYRKEAIRKNARPAKEVEYWTVDGDRWVEFGRFGRSMTKFNVPVYPGSSEVTGDWFSAPFAVAAYNGSGSQLGVKRVAHAGCANSYFISARGTDQNPSPSEKNPDRYAYGLGSRGAEVYNQARRRLGLSEAQFQAVSVNYPAFNFVHWRALLANPFSEKTSVKEFRNSVNNGSSATAAKVRSIVAKCPSARIILFGYSQGAQAVGNGYQLLSATEKAKVTQMHLFADPRRRTKDPRVDYEPTKLGWSGVFPNPRPVFADTVKPQVVSWCWLGDDVCNFVPIDGFTLHGDPYDCYEDHAALRIAQRARDIGWQPKANVDGAECNLSW